MNVSRSSGAETARLVMANHGVCNLFIPIQLLLYTPPMRFLFFSSSEFHFFFQLSVRPSVFFSLSLFLLLSPNQVRFALSQWTSWPEFKLALRSASFPQLIFSSHLFFFLLFFVFSVSGPDGKLIDATKQHEQTLVFMLFVLNA